MAHTRAPVNASSSSAAALRPAIAGSEPCRKALAGREGRARIDDDDLETGDPRDRGERLRRVHRADDHEPRRRPVHIDEHRSTAMFDESASSARSVEADMSSRRVMRDSQGAPPSSGVTSPQARRAAYSPRMSARSFTKARSSLWTWTPMPRRMAVPGACDLIRAAEVQQSRRAIFDHVERRRDDVAFDAAARGRAEKQSGLLDDEMRSRGLGAEPNV